MTTRRLITTSTTSTTATTTVTDTSKLPSGEPAGAGGVSYTRTIVGHARYRAQLTDRADLVERLDPHYRALEHVDRATVAFVGLCDAGKTTLINACVGEDVLPVDLLHSMPMPVAVRSGSGLVRLHRAGVDGTMNIEEKLIDESFDVGGALASDGQVGYAEVGWPNWSRAASLTIVDVPAWSLSSTTSRELLASLDADVLVLVTDAGQELSHLELAAVAKADRDGMTVAVLLTKVDLHPHWRRIKEVDEEHLRRAGVEAPVLPISTRLHTLGTRRADRALVGEAGLGHVFDLLDRTATAERLLHTRARALDAVLDVTSELSRMLQSQRELADDLTVAALSSRQLSAAHERLERLRSAGAKWRERLYDGLERLQFETDHDLRARLSTLQDQALLEIETDDPADVWAGLAMRLEHWVDDEVNATFEALDHRFVAVAADVARLFDEERDAIEPIVASVASGRADLDGARIDRALDLSEQERGAAVINAVRGSAVTLSVTGMATRYGMVAGIGLVPISIALFPLTAAMTLLLGHRAFRASKEAAVNARRRAATLAVRKYLDDVGSTAAAQLRSDLMSFRVELRSHFEQLSVSLATRVEAEMRTAADSARMTETERQHAVGGIDEELQQVQLIAAHARRARAELALGASER